MSSPSNQIYPFCPTDTGSNLDSLSTYPTDATNGNQPGVASSQLNNRALRQGTYLATEFAQYMVNKNNTDVLDNATPAQLLSNIKGAFEFLLPIETIFSSGSGTFNLSYKFKIASGNATSEPPIQMQPQQLLL